MQFAGWDIICIRKLPRIVCRHIALCIFNRLTIEAPVTVKPAVESLDDLLLFAEKLLHADAAGLKWSWY